MATIHSPLLDKSVQPGVQRHDVKEETKQPEIQLLDVKEETEHPEISQFETNKYDECIRLYIDDDHKNDKLYFFCGRLNKIDDSKKPEITLDDEKKTEITFGDTVFVSTKGERDICYLQFTINHISIDENYETRNAECLIDMIVKLYWLFDEVDYETYQTSQLSSKNKYTPSWEPQFEFYKATVHTDK
eukprot:431518_1